MVTAHTIEDAKTEMRLEHFKASYDPSWDYGAIADSLFDGERILVCAEKMDVNAHVHFQGYTNLAPASFDKRITSLAETHYKRKHNPKCRPVLRHKRACTEGGFQYICKELDNTKPPLFSRGFTEEELSTLRDESDKLVEGLKEGLGDFLKAQTFKMEDEKNVYHNFLLKTSEYLIANDKKIGRHTRHNVLNAMMTHPQATERWKVFALMKA